MLAQVPGTGVHQQYTRGRGASATHKGQGCISKTQGAGVHQQNMSIGTDTWASGRSRRGGPCAPSLGSGGATATNGVSVGATATSRVRVDATATSGGQGRCCGHQQGSG